MAVDVRVGDTAQMRKPHPCGSLEWEVTGIGADIRLKCKVCARRVILDRETFERRLKSLTKANER